MGEQATRPREPRERWLTRGVLGVGAASLCSDTSHEMATSLLPSLLTSTLHASPAALGVVEGASDALTGLAKLAGGPLAAVPERRARQAGGGYLLTAVGTAAIGLTAAVWQVAVLRAVAWAARGLRSPARDALVVSLVSPRTVGRAIGVERAGDNTGALLGPLLAAVLVPVLGIRTTIMVGVVPGLLAVAAIAVAGREARSTLGSTTQRARISLRLREMRRLGLARGLAPIVLFEFGNLAATMLILRATTALETAGRGVTAAASLAVTLYLGHNAAAAASSLVSGHVVDRATARLALGIGVGVYVASYVAFAADSGAVWLLLVGFVCAGVGIGFVETAESAVVASLLPDRLRSQGFGVLGLVQAAGDLVATVVAGVLWTAFSPTVAFGYAACWMVASLLAVAFVRAPGSLEGAGAT